MKAEIVQPCQNSNVKAVPAETNKMQSKIYTLRKNLMTQQTYREVAELFKYIYAVARSS